LEADLGTAFDKSQQKFSGLSTGKPFASYSIAKDLLGKREIIRSKIGQLEKLRTTSITNNDIYKDVVTALQELQSQIGQWPDLGAAAASLDVTLQEAESSIESSATVPSSGYSGSPVLLKAVQGLLMGKPIPCADIATFIKNLLDGIAVVRTWQEANEDAIVVSRDYADLVSSGSVSKVQEPKLDEIRNRLISVWTHLWRSTNASDFDSGSGSDLDAAVQGIEQMKATHANISAFAPSTYPLVKVSPASDHLSNVTSISAEEYAQHLPADDSQRAELLERTIDRWDKLSVLLAFLIAVITGLNSNYWGKPFGTFQDYAVLFLWAAGTKVGVDIIAAVTDKFVSAN
jgi:hypothetical protein